MAKNSSLKGLLPHHTFVMAKRTSARTEQNPEPVSVHAESIPLVKPETPTHLDLTGNPASDLWFVGESLDSKAATLFSKMVEAMGKRPGDICFATFPTMGADAKLLAREVKETVANSTAEVVIALGKNAAKLFSESESVPARGKLHPFQRRKLIISYHPQELLIQTALKKEAWEDLKLAMKELRLI